MAVDEELSKQMRLLEDSTFTTPERLWEKFEELSSQTTKQDVIQSFGGLTPEQQKQLDEAIASSRAHLAVAKKILQLLIDETDLSVGSISITTLYVTGVLATAGITPEGTTAYASMLENAVRGAYQISVMAKVKDTLEEIAHGKPRSH